MPGTSNIHLLVPKDPITETENGSMEPKDYAFCFGD